MDANETHRHINVSIHRGHLLEVVLSMIWGLSMLALVSKTSVKLINAFLQFLDAGASLGLVF